MRLCKVAFALLSFATSSCENNNSSRQIKNSCTLDLAASPDGTSKLTGDCTRDAEGIAAAIERAPGILKSSKEIALGRTPFGTAGAFDRCAVMRHLANDPRWAASIDSNAASVPLRDALQIGNLAPSVSHALAKAGRKLRGVSLETVLLSDGPAGDCPRSPAKTPIEAQIWLSLE
ncbi:hypothetical protein [Sphingomonas sp. PB4P5]|uniref:hypothetical protein n=1 Tax=Parasphingomonas puruogangriensis TaxID=3096155 RepID=UPI002FC81AFF